MTPFALGADRKTIGTRQLPPQGVASQAPQAADPYAAIRSLSFRRGQPAEVADYTTYAGGDASPVAGPTSTPTSARPSPYHAWMMTSKGGADPGTGTGDVDPVYSNPVWDWKETFDYDFDTPGGAPPPGFDSKYAAVSGNPDGTINARMQAPGLHKYDTMDAQYQLDPQTGQYTLQGDPSARREVSTGESMVRDSAELAGKGVLMAGGLYLGGLGMSGGAGALGTSMGAGAAGSTSAAVAGGAAIGGGTAGISAGLQGDRQWQQAALRGAAMGGATAYAGAQFGGGGGQNIDQATTAGDYVNQMDRASDLAAAAGGEASAFGADGTRPYQLTNADTALPSEFSGLKDAGAPLETTSAATSDPWGTNTTFGEAGATPPSTGNWWDSLGAGASKFGGKLVDTAGSMVAAALMQKALGPKTPATPDFPEAAKRQGEENIKAAQTQAQLNRVDTTTPFGFQKFTTTPDPTVPGGNRYAQDIGFSPEQQALYESETRNQQGMQDLAGQLQGRVGAGLSQPFALGDAGSAARLTSDPNAYSAERDQVTQALQDRLTRVLGPQQERARAAADLQLRNQGLMPGTEAYSNSMRDLLETQSGQNQDIANRAIEAGGAEQSRLQRDVRDNSGFNNQVRGQTIQELLLQRQQPLAEFNSLRTGNTPTLPTFQPFGMSSVQPAPTMQGANAQYGANADSYNARLARFQNLLNFGAKVSGP